MRNSLCQKIYFKGQTLREKRDKYSLPIFPSAPIQLYRQWSNFLSPFFDHRRNSKMLSRKFTILALFKPKWRWRSWTKSQESQWKMEWNQACTSTANQKAITKSKWPQSQLSKAGPFPTSKGNIPIRLANEVRLYRPIAASLNDPKRNTLAIRSRSSINRGRRKTEPNSTFLVTLSAVHDPRIAQQDSMLTTTSPTF